MLSGGSPPFTFRALLCRRAGIVWCVYAPRLCPVRTSTVCMCRLTEVGLLSMQGCYASGLLNFFVAERAEMGRRRARSLVPQEVWARA